MRQRFSIDFHDNDPSGAMASLPETAGEMLRELDTGLDYGEPISDRVERLERMICMLILRES